MNIWYRIYIQGSSKAVCCTGVFYTNWNKKRLCLHLLQPLLQAHHSFQVASDPFYFLSPTDVLNFIQSLFQTCNCRILMLLHCALHWNLSNSNKKITFKNQCIACSCLQKWLCLQKNHIFNKLLENSIPRIKVIT